MITIKLQRWQILLLVFAFITINLNAQSLKEKAEGGDKVAQYQYANSLTNRYPKEEDYKKAFEWYMKSAEQGYAPSQCSLAYCYWKAQGVERNYEQAVYWYKKSAEQGDEVAQYNLGICYANGQGVPQSDYYAFMWYKKAAEQGYVSAEYSLGKAYYHGKGTVKNFELALECFNKAVAQKHSGAMYYLGTCYLLGNGVPKNLEKAIEWFKKGVEDSDVRAQYTMAMLYLEGKGVDKDSIYATDLLLHSAGGGWCGPEHKFNFDKKKANIAAKKKLLELSSLKNSPKQYYFLAMTGCLYDAMEDYKIAEEYYKRSIEQGGYLGIIQLGLMYFYIAANTTQLFINYDSYEHTEEELVLESYMFQDNTSCMEYVKTKEWTETDNITYWLEKAIDFGLGSFEYGAMSYSLYEHLLFAYVNGIGTKRNINRAVEIVKLCLADTTTKHEIALDVLEIASSKLELQSEIFKTYLKSYESFKNHQNEDNKWDCSRMAAGLGKCYYKGLGTMKNYNLAFCYLSEAASKNNCESMRLLAACYRYGRGTSINPVKETEWLEKAAECGDDSAKRIKKVVK